MTNNTQDVKPILVLGGTGKTGRRVVERLTARGIPTRIGSRSAQPRFDWDDQTTWVPALHGVAAAYVSFYPDLAVPGCGRIGSPGSSPSFGVFTAEVSRRGLRRLRPVHLPRRHAGLADPLVDRNELGVATRHR